MLKQERQQKIVDILNEEHKVIASDLSKRLSVSEDTIRRDLKELHNQGVIKRVHSGALRKGPPVEDFSTRQGIYNESKLSLASKALEFIHDDMVLLIDGGTTNLQLVHQLPMSLKATVITNSPPIATALTNHESVEVIMVGGTLFKQSMVNLGIDTFESLNAMRADLYIMGIYKIDAQNGISVPSMAEALVKRKMAAVSTEILGMVTSDKLDTISNHIVCPTEELTYLITEKVNPDIKKLYEQQSVTILD
ncbi:DeoR/GlpR family DNA-binding transcription regulator [Halobacillus sp. ACCC02827]|uniref:DeoR/GlpR family DNA-binding transcription regulator n=1 Tax=Bacillaceae TaxID=186817 RepID=UPI0002A5081C|nr:MULTISPECIES: DeoR/GlpR family DNA-binding transcription regulator [Bacillaceae]ELK47850.1 DeoR family transcriptional regulator [Halobacillus sp. BAB-2008]QHT48515.1 DeoR/GlpR transcriptional regulator [Bacillus sp. SB49]WJE15739.1 DeoR/GlpR family DNA-binding transcription regulator [Halobacillus sp. ACCC02827]